MRVSSGRIERPGVEDSAFVTGEGHVFWGLARQRDRNARSTIPKRVIYGIQTCLYMFHVLLLVLGPSLF